MIKTDCLYYIGERPCKFQKNHNIECNENCNYYTKIDKRILIIKKDALGDVLRTTPLIHSIKEKYGNKTHITWLTNPNAYDLLKNNPLINRIYRFEFPTILHLEFEEYDILFNIDKDRPSLGLSKKIRAKHKFGYTMNGCGNLTTFKHNKPYALKLGISDYLKKINTKTYQEIICELLELPYSITYQYIFNIPKKEKIVKELVEKYKISFNQTIVGFNTGAGPRFLSKLWPKEYFIQLGKKLINEKGCSIMLLGGEKEIEINNYIYEKIKKDISLQDNNKIINTGSNNSLIEFATLISMLDILITGDTLALHLAIALNKKFIALFGPTSANEIETYGIGIKLVAPSECLLCYKKSCKLDKSCMSLITVLGVYNNILENIEEH